MGLVVVLVQRLTARRHAGARSSEVPTPAVAPDALG
jgi:hypothetical protein